MRVGFLYLFITLSACALSSLHAQPVLFARDYASANDLSNSAKHCHTSDGGSILVSHTVGQSFIHYNVVVKTSANGTWQWTRRFVVQNSNVSNIIQLSDGGYCFSYLENPNDNVYRVVKLDNGGNTVYSNSYLLPVNYHCVVSPVLLPNPNGGFYLASDVRMPPTIYACALMEIDLAGNLLWSNYYNDNVSVNISMCRCANGDVLLCGSRGVTMSSNAYPFVTRVDSSGTLLWSKYYVYAGSQVETYAIQELGNGNIAVVGRINGSMSVPNETYYLQTDPNGTLIRTKRYGNAQSLLQSNAAVAVENNNLLISGNAGSFGSSTFVAKLDAQCNVVFSTFYQDVHGFSLDTTAGPGYSVSGNDGTTQHMILFTTDINLHSCFDSPFTLDTSQFILNESVLSGSASIALTPGAFLLQDTILPLNSADLCGKSGIPVSPSLTDVQFFPNPAHSTVTISSPENILSIRVYNAVGQCVSETPVNSGLYELDVSGLLPGIYVLEVFSGTDFTRRKLFVE